MTYQYFINVITQHYADFNGRARRSEYWYFALFNIITSVILTYGIGAIIGAAAGAGLSAIYSLAVILPGLGVVVRRLHDVGKSGWFFLIVLIPLVGVIWLLVLFCTEGTIGMNEYGPNPKGIGNDFTDDQAIKSIGQ